MTTSLGNRVFSGMPTTPEDSAEAAVIRKKHAEYLADPHLTDRDRIALIDELYRRAHEGGEVYPLGGLRIGGGA